jgi:hypothetical protein
MIKYKDKNKIINRNNIRIQYNNIILIMNSNGFNMNNHYNLVNIIIILNKYNNKLEVNKII